MIKYLKMFAFMLLAFVFTMANAYAEGSGAGTGGASGGDIFGQLATKAETIGGGLRSSGFIIAAIALLVFSFMAIFNKISWKTLAYIMMSTFLLTVMVAAINYFADGKASIDLPSFTGPSSITDGMNDVTRNKVSKMDGGYTGN